MCGKMVRLALATPLLCWACLCLTGCDTAKEVPVVPPPAAAPAPAPEKEPTPPVAAPEPAPAPAPEPPPPPPVSPVPKVVWDYARGQYVSDDSGEGIIFRLHFVVESNPGNAEMRGEMVDRFGTAVPITFTINEAGVFFEQLAVGVNHSGKPFSVNLYYQEAETKKWLRFSNKEIFVE